MKKLLLPVAVALLFCACTKRLKSAFVLPKTAIVQFKDKSLVKIPNREFNFKVGTIITVYKEDGRFLIPRYRSLPGTPLKDTIIRKGGHTIWNFTGKVIAVNN